MTLKTALLPCIAIGLGACGGSGDGTNPNSFTEFVAIYPSTVRDGTNTEYDELENGMVAYIGGEDGSVGEFRVRIDRMGTRNDASDDVLYVERDGGPAVAYVPVRIDRDDGTDLSILWRAANGDEFNLGTQGFDPLLSLPVPDIDPTIIFASYATDPGGAGEVLGFGGGGLETAVGELPAAANYVGEYALFTATGDLEILGAANMDVDFASGQITGTHNGDMDVGGVTGVVTGSVSGSRVGGSMTVTGDAVGDLAFGGSVTGPSGARIVLGIAGTVDAGAGNQTLGGRGVLFQRP